MNRRSRFSPERSVCALRCPGNETCRRASYLYPLYVSTQVPPFRQGLVGYEEHTWWSSSLAAQPHTAEDVTSTDTSDKAPESTRVGVSPTLSRVSQPPDLLQSVREHSSTRTWLTLRRSCVWSLEVGGEKTKEDV